jgi:membrane fusion protein (multidrug efflux system)
MDDRQDPIDAPAGEHRESLHDDATSKGGHVAPETKASPGGKAAEGDNAAAAAAEKRPPWGFILLGAVVVAGLIGGGWYWYATRDLESTDDAFLDGRAITIAPQVKGVAIDLAVTDNQFIHAGDVLLRIDPRDYLAARDLARGQLALAQAQRQAAAVNLDLVRLTAPQKLLQARAQSVSAVAAQYVAGRDDRRQHALTPLVVSRQQVEQATSTDAQAGAQTAEAEAAVAQAELIPQLIAQAAAPVAEADGQIEQARANLDQAELNLSYTVMLAPRDGWITRRNVERGDYLQVGAAVFSIVATELWVTANFKETQLDRMRPGQHVAIGVDAYPSLKLNGHVDSVQRGTGSKFTAFPPENATGNFVKIVQRVPVKIVIDGGLDPRMALPLGLSVDPTVDVK